MVGSWAQVSCWICSAFHLTVEMEKKKTGSQGYRIYSRIKETIDMVSVPKVLHYLCGEMKNISCLHSKAMGVYRTIILN